MGKWSGWIHKVRTEFFSFWYDCRAHGSEKILHAQASFVYMMRACYDIGKALGLSKMALDAQGVLLDIPGGPDLINTFQDGVCKSVLEQTERGAKRMKCDGCPDPQPKKCGRYGSF